MNKCYLDSNFLIHLKNEDAKENADVVTKLNGLITNNFSLYISPLVLDEFLHAIKLKLTLAKTKNIYGLLKINFEDILELPALNLVNPPGDLEAQKRVVELMEKYSLRPRDAYHLLIMEENEIESFATFDNDFSTVFESKILKKV